MAHLSLVPPLPPHEANGQDVLDAFIAVCKGGFRLPAAVLCHLQQLVNVRLARSGRRVQWTVPPDLLDLPSDLVRIALEELNRRELQPSFSEEDIARLLAGKDQDEE